MKIPNGGIKIPIRRRTHSVVAANGDATRWMIFSI